MSIGDLITNGNKGNNFPWQLKMLIGQQCTCDELQAINANTDNLEFLLSSILTTLQSSTEYEAKFVVDTCDSDKVYLEVRVWNPDTSTWGPITYYIPGNSTPVTPVGEATPGCLQYTDPSGVLGMILAELQLQTPILQSIDSNTSVLATETTLQNVDSNIANILGNTDGVLRTPNMIRTTSSGNVNTVVTTFYSVSVANVGSADGTVLGATIKPGEVLNFDASSLNHYFNSFVYNATGTEFIIIFVS